MHISPFHALYPNVPRLPEVPDFFDTAKERYQKLAQSGYLIPTAHASFFLYRIQGKQRYYQGVLACTAIADYLCGDIKKHESTILDLEQKQMLLTQEHQAMVKPVLLVYPDAPQIDAWIAAYIGSREPFLEIYFEKDLQTHQLWAVQAPEAIGQLQTLFRKYVPHSYIADGHHRMAALGLLAKSEEAAIRKQYQHVYCAFFPSIELDILAFNRVVEVPAHFELRQLEPLLHIQPLAAPAKPSQLHEMTLCTAQGWYQLRWKEEVLQKFKNEEIILDTMLLNEQILQPILSIDDVRYDRRVEYVEAPKNLETLENKIAQNPNRIAFCLFPVAFEDLMTLVEANKTLPPKSTWFEPRMKNGLLVKPY